MKKKAAMSILILLAWLVLIPSSSRAQWKALDGYFTTQCYPPVFFDTVIYAASEAGLLASRDSGQSWNRENFSITPFGRHLYFGGGKLIFNQYLSYNHWLSQDSGRTWNSMTVTGSAYIPGKYQVDSSIIYLCCYTSIYKSVNNGLSWTIIPYPSNGSYINELKVNQGRIYLSRSGQGATSGPADAFFSDNGGSTWTTISKTGMIPAISHEIRQMIVNGNLIFLVGSNGLYKSTDRGSTWTLFTSGLSSNNYYDYDNISLAGNKIYAFVRDGGLFESDTSVASFVSISNNLPVSVKVTSVAKNNNRLIATTNSGFFYSELSPVNWNSGKINIPYSGVQTIAAIDSNVVLGTSYGAFTSHNNGDSFNTIPSLGEGFGTFYSSNETIYACTRTPYKSDTTVSSWTRISYPAVLQDFCTLNNNYFGVTNDVIRYSSNSGISWSQLNNPVSFSFYINDIESSNNTLIVSSSKGIYTTADLGVTWNLSLPGTGFAIAKDSNIIYTLAMPQGSSTSNIFRSVDDGATWQMLSLPSTINPSKFTVNKNTLIVYPGFYVSNDSGFTWTTLTSLPRAATIYPVQLLLNDSSFFIAYSDSVFRSDSNLVFITSVNEENKYTYLCEAGARIFPNPMKELLCINFIKPLEYDVFFALYNVFGKEVFSQRLISDSNTINLKDTGLANGIYYYTLSVPGKSIESGKLVVAK